MNIEKVLIVEDETLMREYLFHWLGTAGYRVVGAASDRKTAQRMSERQEPDLVLLDMDLPDGEGWEFIERQMARRPSTRILVLTAHVGSYPVLKLKKSGVMGVLDKAETDGEELLRAVNAIASWRTYYTDRVERTFRELVQEGTAFYKTLSPREEELIRYFALGLSNAEIGDRVGLRESTVQGHRRNVMGKVGVGSTPELMAWSIRQGFVCGRQIQRAHV